MQKMTMEINTISSTKPPTIKPIIDSFDIIIIDDFVFDSIDRVVVIVVDFVFDRINRAVVVVVFVVVFDFSIVSLIIVVTL